MHDSLRLRALNIGISPNVNYSSQSFRPPWPPPSPHLDRSNRETIRKQHGAGFKSNAYAFLESYSPRQLLVSVSNYSLLGIKQNPLFQVLIVHCANNLRHHSSHYMPSPLLPALPWPLSSAHPPVQTAVGGLSQRCIYRYCRSIVSCAAEVRYHQTEILLRLEYLHATEKQLPSSPPQFPGVQTRVEVLDIACYPHISIKDRSEEEITGLNVDLRWIL